MNANKAIKRGSLSALTQNTYSTYTAAAVGLKLHRQSLSVNCISLASAPTYYSTLSFSSCKEPLNFDATIPEISFSNIVKSSFTGNQEVIIIMI